MTSSEMKVRTNNQDQLKKTIILREKLNKSTSNQGSLILSPNHGKQIQAANVIFNCAHNSPLVLKYKRECFNNYVQPHNQITNSLQRLKRMKVAVDLDSMETEQIVGIYKFLEKVPDIKSVALWSCFFNYNDVSHLLESELYEDSMTLKEASNQFTLDNRRMDRLCNSPVRSKYLSQNYMDNYLFIEGICKNLNLSGSLRSVAFCGLRLSPDSLRILNETIMKNKVLKELTFNYCLIDNGLMEVIMPSLCQNKCIETLNLACNGLDDKTSYLISKIISAQSERRDHIVWAYSLRGELPPNDEYKLGLKEIILSHNNYSDVLASELALTLRNDVYLRSIDLRNNNIGEYWVSELIKVMKTNCTLTNMDLRENPGLTQKLHRGLALHLLKNIQELKEKGELEELENPEQSTINRNHVLHREDSIEIKSKFVKSDVLTIEIPKKFLKKFSQRIMAIKGSNSSRKSVSARNSSYDATVSEDKKSQLNIKIENKKTTSKQNAFAKRFTPSTQRSRAGSSAKTKATSMQSLTSSKKSQINSKTSLIQTQEYIMASNINLLADNSLEPIGEEIRNESATSMKILKQQLEDASNKRNQSVTEGNCGPFKKKGHTQVSSVEMASPYQAKIVKEDEEQIIDISSSKNALHFTEEELLDPLKQKIMDQRLIKMNSCNHCHQCQEVQRQFYLTEGKSLSLAIENYKLKKALRSIAETSQENYDAVTLAYTQNLSPQKSLGHSQVANLESQESVYARMEQLIGELNQLVERVEVFDGTGSIQSTNSRQSRGKESSKKQSKKLRR